LSLTNLPALVILADGEKGCREIFKEFIIGGLGLEERQRPAYGTFVF